MSQTDGQVVECKKHYLQFIYLLMVIDFSSKITLFPIFWKTWHGPTNQPTDRRTDPLIEMIVASKNEQNQTFFLCLLMLNYQRKIFFFYL